MHNFSTYLASASLLLTCLAVIYAVSARRYAHSCYEFVSTSNERSVALKQLTLIETQLTEHADSIEALLKSQHKLRSRIHARTINEKKTDADGCPDPNIDPDGWKRYMNAQIAPTSRKE